MTHANASNKDRLTATIKKALHDRGTYPDAPDFIADRIEEAGLLAREWVSVKEGGLPPPNTIYLCRSNGTIEVGDSSLGFVTLENNPFLAESGWDGTFVDGRAEWGGRPLRFREWMPVSAFSQPPQADTGEKE